MLKNVDKELLEKLWKKIEPIPLKKWHCVSLALPSGYSIFSCQVGNFVIDLSSLSVNFGINDRNEQIIILSVRRENINIFQKEFNCQEENNFVKLFKKLDAYFYKKMAAKKEQFLNEFGYILKRR